jgi:hypothetical protein
MYMNSYFDINNYTEPFKYYVDDSIFFNAIPDRSRK